MRLRLLLLGLLMFTARASAQEPPDEPKRKAGEVVLKATSFDVPNVGKLEFDLGTLYVPEVRSEPKSRLIGVGFARFKAKEKTDAPPIFLLPGGPGGSYVSDLKPGRVSAGQLQQVLAFQAISDVVLVDQRGFSEHGDVLKFRFRTPDEPLDEPASSERRTKAFVDMARTAVKEFDEKKIDLRGYTVKECADDVNDLAEALGYKQITLTGGSFGSQWSFAIMRQHPERVARALLSGVEPLDCGYDMPSHVMAAVQRMWWEAEQDEKLKPYLPPGGLMAAAREVVERLKREPVQVTLKGVTDSKTGKPIVVTLGDGDFQQAAQSVFRGNDGPAFVLSLYHGHYDQLAFRTNLARRSRQIEMPLIGPLIDTSLAVTPQRRYLLRNDPACFYLGQWNFDSYMATEDIWPSPDVGDKFRTEVPCSIPVVFVQGDWDAQTPVENLLQVVPHFRKGHVLIVERGGHGAMGQVARELPETKDSLLDFLKTGNTSDLPTRVTLPKQKFAVPSFPPPKQ